jgi:uncharacterized Zn finger protein (UPF0148 family)
MEHQFQLLGIALHCRRCNGRALVPLFDVEHPPALTCPSCGARGLPDDAEHYTPAREPQQLPWSRRRRR